MLSLSYENEYFLHATFIVLQIKLIYMWKVAHQDLFLNRGKKQLGNGLFPHELIWTSAYGPQGEALKGRSIMLDMLC